MTNVKRSLAVVAMAAVMQLLGPRPAFVRTAYAADPSPPIPTGVCCLGPKVAPLFDVTQEHCQTLADTYVWILGDFDETSDVTPCDLLPGGD